MVDPMADFLNLVFLTTLPKNDRRDLKMGCIDASRRQQYLCSKLGSKLIFFGRNYGNFSFANPFLDFDRIFLIVIPFKVQL
jgi:hypothetical protein